MTGNQPDHVQREQTPASPGEPTPLAGKRPLFDLDTMLEGNNYFLFDGDQSASVENVNINMAFYSDPGVPQGTVAEVSGIIAHGGYTGRFEAVLE